MAVNTETKVGSARAVRGKTFRPGYERIVGPNSRQRNTMTYRVSSKMVAVGWSVIAESGWIIAKRPVILEENCRS